MGCARTKAKRYQNNHIDEESYQYVLIKRIVAIADQIDILKDEYLYSCARNISNFDTDNYCQIINLNDFLLTAYKVNANSKQKLKTLQTEISEILKEGSDIYDQVHPFITKLDCISQATSTSVSTIRTEIEIIFRDFLVFYQKISSSSHKMPEVQFDNYSKYEISKRISNIDTHSIIE